MLTRVQPGNLVSTRHLPHAKDYRFEQQPEESVAIKSGEKNENTSYPRIYKREQR